jgi:hypothetical protein
MPAMKCFGVFKKHGAGWSRNALDTGAKPAYGILVTQRTGKHIAKTHFAMASLGDNVA